MTKRNNDLPVIDINNLDLELSSRSEVEMVLKFEDTKKEEINELEISRFRYQKKILIVDDQSFNIEAVLIILKYSVGLDS